MATFSSAVSVPIRWKAWNTIPIFSRRKRARRSSDRPAKSVPATFTRPELARSNPAITIRRLDLPDPDGPTTPKVSPARTDRSMSARILTWPAGPASVRETFSSKTDGSTRDAVMKAFSMRWRALSAYGLLALIVNLTAPAASAAPIRILAFGDSLTAGYNLPPGQSFADQLETALKAKGYDVTVIQGGVSGDTSTGGKARLDWVLGGAQADHVIVELGANDALRGIDPAQTEANLDAILTALENKNVKVLLAGMLAPPNLGADYQKRFNPIYPTLAKKHKVALYPFFLEGVAAHPDLQLSDGMHPTVQGVGVMVKNMLPAITAWLGAP